MKFIIMKKKKDKEESKGQLLQQIKGQNCLIDEPRPPRECNKWRNKIMLLRIS